MPNWCVGTFRARGPLESIERFIMEGLESVSGNGENDFRIEKTIYADDTFEFEVKGQNMAHIAGTRRHFLDFSEWPYINLHRIKDCEGLFGFAAPFRAAWSINLESIIRIAEQFAIRLRVNGFEMGMQFTQLIEVDEHGRVICDSTMQYMDYEWECQMPLLGG